MIKSHFLICLMLTNISSYCQSSAIVPDLRSDFHFGVKLGLNVSNVYDSQGEDFVANGKAGLATGLFVQIPLGKYIGIQPELLYSQKGFKGKGVILGNPYSYTRTTDYLDVPILLAIKPLQILTILVGPQYSYLIRQKSVFENTLFTSSQEQEFKNDNVRKNTMCVLGGADVNIKRLVISARVGWDVQSNNGDGNSTTPRYKNVWYQATLGVRL